MIKLKFAIVALSFVQASISFAGGGAGPGSATGSVHASPVVPRDQVTGHVTYRTVTDSREQTNILIALNVRLAGQRFSVRKNGNHLNAPAIFGTMKPISFGYGEPVPYNTTAYVSTLNGLGNRIGTDYFEDLHTLRISTSGQPLIILESLLNPRGGTQDRVVITTDATYQKVLAVLITRVEMRLETQDRGSIKEPQLVQVPTYSTKEHVELIAIP